LEYRRGDELRPRTGGPKRRQTPREPWDESGSRSHRPAESGFEVIETEADCGFEAPRRHEETGQDQDKSAGQANCNTEIGRFLEAPRCHEETARDFEAPGRCDETGQDQDEIAGQADRDTETHSDEEGWHQEGNGQGREAREHQRQHWSPSGSDHKGS